MLAYVITPIMANIWPREHIPLYYALTKKLQALWKMKFGDARIRPFTNMQDEEKVLTVKNLLSHEYEVLKKMLL